MRSALSVLAFSAPLLLLGLHACGGDAIEESSPAMPRVPTPASPAEATGSAPAARVDMPDAAVLPEDTRARLPWLGGTLIAERDAEEPRVPMFVVEGTGRAAPDFSALAWKQVPDYGYGAAQYASLASGEVLVFDGAKKDDRTFADGIFRWSFERGARFEALPIPSTYGAFFPTALVARATDDVWAGAAIKREPFEDDFPGCPITVWSSLDDVYLAHYDGAAWTHVWTPHQMGRLRAITDRDGTLVLETGWGPDRPDYLSEAGEDATWERSAKGIWTKMQ